MKYPIFYLLVILIFNSCTSQSGSTSLQTAHKDARTPANLHCDFLASEDHGRCKSFTVSEIQKALRTLLLNPDAFQVFDFRKGRVVMFCDLTAIARILKRDSYCNYTTEELIHYAINSAPLVEDASSILGDSTKCSGPQRECLLLNFLMRVMRKSNTTHLLNYSPFKSNAKGSKCGT